MPMPPPLSEEGLPGSKVSLIFQEGIIISLYDSWISSFGWKLDHMNT